MSFLLKARFDENGCYTDYGITSITPSTNVNIFTEPSPLKNGYKCVTFPVNNYDSGLKKKTEISIGQNQPFTIYMKYKINVDYLDKEYNTPIISFGNENLNDKTKNLLLKSLEFKNIEDVYINTNEDTGNTNSIDNIGIFNWFLFIQNREYFSILLNKQEGFSSKIAYTFDDRWHTLCITRDSNNVVRFFIDGHQSTKNDSDGSAIYLGNTIYFGKYKPTSNISVSMNGCSLDDICILDECIYTDNFIPPTMYFTGKDDKENYQYYNISNTDNITDEIQKAVEDKMFSTASHINNRQMGWLPRRLRIRWYEHSRKYFRNEEYTWTKPRPNATILNIYGLENFTIYGYEKSRFLEGNAYRLLEDGKITAFILFINKQFVKLSDIDMVKSDWWMTFFIKGRDPRYNPKVKSVDIILIPFPIIYEEGLGEREDIKPLYQFDENGLFTTSNGYTFYYLDKDHSPKGLTTLGILDQYIPTVYDNNKNNEDLYNDNMFMHNIWRFGTLEENNVINTSATYRFNCTSDERHIYPGDKINLYMHTLYISEDRYRIVGEDLIEFYDKNDINYDNFVVSMQLITDNREWELQDLTEVKVEEVIAEIDNQSSFNIPKVVDDDGYPYRYFLIFRGSVCILNTDRFIISDDYSTLTFTNTDDFVPKGTKLYFVFVKILRSDQFGPLHVKPIFLSTKVDPDTTNSYGANYTYKIKIPDLHGLEYNINNVMLFIQNTFISPERYIIEDNTVILTKYTGDMFLKDKHATFVLLKMVNKFEDPIDDHDRVVYEEVQRGRRYVLYELPINKYRQITIDNFVTFDNDGYYISNLFGEVMNRNIIKELHTDDPLHIVPRYLTCVYSEESLPNESNCLIPTNDDFINGYITLKNEFYELDDKFKEFMSDFDISYDKNVHYGQNLARALDYIVCYNPNKLDKAYEKLSLVDRFTYITKDFISMIEDINNSESGDPNKKFFIKENMLKYYQFYINGTPYLGDKAETDESKLKYKMELDRQIFCCGYYDSYPIYFVNGMLPSWYQYTIYENNRMTIRMEEKPLNTDSIELLLFRKIHNFLYKLDNTIENNEPKRFDKYIDGYINIDKKDFSKYIITEGNFEYITGRYTNENAGEGALLGQLEIINNQIDNNDNRYNIAGQLNIEFNEWKENTSPGYGTIDGIVDIEYKEYGKDDYNTDNEIFGYLELNPNYRKYNVLKGYEFIDNTFIDTTYISLDPSELEFTIKQNEFIKSEYESEEPELGEYQFDATFNTTINLEFSDVNEFFDSVSNYWYDYRIGWKLIENESSNSNTSVSDYSFDISINNISNTINIPIEIITSFYTNENSDSYLVPYGVYTYEMTLTMKNSNNINKSAKLLIKLNVDKIDIVNKDLNLISLEFYDI